VDNSYIPEQSFYSGNGLISGNALQDIAEHIGDYRCTDYIRKAFAEILDSLNMPDGDRTYYKLLAGAKEIA
jgi:hypothetical protein